MTDLTGSALLGVALVVAHGLKSLAFLRSFSPTLLSLSTTMEQTSSAACRQLSSRGGNLTMSATSCLGIFPTENA